MDANHYCAIKLTVPKGYNNATAHLSQVGYLLG